MKRLWILTFSFLLVFGAAGGTLADTVPSATFYAGETQISIPLIAQMGTDGKAYYVFDTSAAGWTAGALNNTDMYFYTAGAVSIAIDPAITRLDPDPIVTYGIAVQNNLAGPQNFAFVFNTGPFGPLAGGTVNASISGAFTDATGNGVSISPVAPQNCIQVSNLANAALGGPPPPPPAPGAGNMGVDVGPAVGFPPGAAGALYTYGPFASGPLAAPPGNWTWLNTTVYFTLNPAGDSGGDWAVLTGFAQFTPVPVPPTLGLLGLGFLGLLAIGFRKKS